MRPPPTVFDPGVTLTAPRTATIALLFLLFTFLTTALGVYQHRQGALTLEGNSLYSPSAVAVDADAEHVVNALAERGSSGRVFLRLTDDGRVRALSSIGSPGRPLLSTPGSNQQLTMITSHSSGLLCPFDVRRRTTTSYTTARGMRSKDASGSRRRASSPTRS
ncbi:hypothetical protein GCM10025867_11200 [Frondihabitans sucicola]|uniref:Uncharacterized protein n=1 Tax=Frondihabitans sucicola TaxID=1268041 RepID=A0ABM8GKG6_9MICO|nr:hypothetical protein GCM10025867_11200 [Frondihabitans sucicola]